ncbi:Low-density lipoprotein receptor-related protein 11 [Vespula squamosa]|uniref:Low-density lipoprotein receptor-related protein 11 n=1 Tax=Vespula squamosa TaxID=30214 RepID=A0ABD2BF90_VESSQ
MSYRDLYGVLSFIVIFYSINGEISLKKNEKHTDIANNYDACFESFDVHTNKIIKTEDSCDLGAKYLNVLDLESREDCFKYCCNTDKCDVFIFEEKKPGSCYLFECGPLEDFKCKFTTHVNYTSAVLTNYNIRNHAQLEEEIQISQHEHELKSLRKLSNVQPVEYVVTEHNVKPSVTVTSHPILTTPPVKQGCSHNQYECRSNGDCIAIYNVCDGIPQCADGSDEAADLVCPTEKPTVSASVVIQGPSPQLPSNVIKYQQMINQHKKVYHRGSENNPKRWELSQPQNLLYPVQMEKSFGAPAYQWDYQPLYEQNKDSYVPGNSYHGQSNFNAYDQNQPHSFTHKGSSVIGEPDVDRLNSLCFSNVYADSKNPYPSHFSPNKGMWQEAQVQLAPSITPNLPQKLDNYLSKDTKNTVSPPCETSVQHTDTLIKDKEIKGKVDKKKQEETSNIKIDKHNTEKSNTTKIDVSKQNHERKSELTDHKSIIILENRAKEHERSSVVAEHLQQINENDNLRPKGAVISLALGLITTAITAALIACRLRIVKRRGHRGHGPYAHDPDYLVNGMYL